jgi:hypothetical protein
LRWSESISTSANCKLSTPIPLPTAPGLGIIASAIMLGFGLWWLSRAEAKARAKGEGYGADALSTEDAKAAEHASEDLIVRERAAGSFDPNEIAHRDESAAGPRLRFCRWSSSSGSTS